MSSLGYVRVQPGLCEGYTPHTWQLHIWSVSTQADMEDTYNKKAEAPQAVSEEECQARAGVSAAIRGKEVKTPVRVLTTHSYQHWSSPAVR